MKLFQKISLFLGFGVLIKIIVKAQYRVYINQVKKLFENKKAIINVKGIGYKLEILEKLIF